MATYQTFIDEVRKANRDLPRTEFDTFDGDNATTRFILSHDNIVAGSYVVKVGGTTKTETTHYTIDADSGEVTFTSGNAPASGNDNVTVEYEYTNVRDSEYIEMANAAINKHRQDLWETFLDDSTLSSVADAYEVSLAAVATNVLFVVDFWVKDSQNAGSTVEWKSVPTVTNIKFLKDQQKIAFNPPFKTSNYPFKVHGAKTYATGTTNAATFNPPEKYWSVYKFEVLANYIDRIAFDKLGDKSVVVKEGITYTPSDILFQRAERFRAQAKEELKKIRPKRPPLTIPVVVSGRHV